MSIANPNFLQVNNIMQILARPPRAAYWLQLRRPDRPGRQRTCPSAVSWGLSAAVCASLVQQVTYASRYYLQMTEQLPIIVPLLASIAVTVIFCLINGFGVAYLKMHAFIITLGTQLIAYGANCLYIEAQSAGSAQALAVFDRNFVNIAGGNIRIGSVNISYLIVIFLVVAALMWVVWNKTRLGKNMFAAVTRGCGRVPGSIFIGTTPREAGDMQGEILSDMYNADPSSVDLNGDGVVHFVEFMGEPNNPEAIARTQYSEETAIALGVPLEPVLEDPIVANWDTAQANDRMTATWAAHPEIEVVFCNNDDMATGVIAAMNAFNYNTGREGDPALVVIGVDATDAAFEAIAAGKMTATVKQDGDAMGYANVRIAVNYLQTGTWLDGLDYTLAEDGYSVRIPYAKITADEVE